MGAGEPAFVLTPDWRGASLADGAAETIATRIGTLRLVGAPDRGTNRQERRLIRAARTGSEEALETLYRKHWPLAHRAAYLVVHDSAAAEDIAQESFLAALRALDRFDRRRPFGPWLNRIVVNRAIDWARARAARRETAVGPDPSPRGDPALTAGHPYSEEILAALASLSPEHRAVVVLRYLLECTPGEIAEMLELPRGTVNSRLRRALDRLEVRLEGERP
jgi:RNA polymerase sigma-70 factor (ECF subfamily)